MDNVKEQCSTSVFLANREHGILEIIVRSFLNWISKDVHVGEYMDVLEENLKDKLLPILCVLSDHTLSKEERQFHASTESKVVTLLSMVNNRYQLLLDHFFPYLNKLGPP